MHLVSKAWIFFAEPGSCEVYLRRANPSYVPEEISLFACLLAFLVYHPEIRPVLGEKVARTAVYPRLDILSNIKAQSYRRCGSCTPTSGI